jgi:glycosyltransferase involved in cell wall biosynthesis
MNPWIINYFHVMPFVSVIIPVFNREKLLSRAIDSVMRQTFRDYELIVVDDASDDGTGNVASVNPDVKYIRLSAHSGVSRARNAGVDASIGEWLCFLDSDDVWHKDKLLRQNLWHKSNSGFRISQTDEIWIRNGVRVNPPVTHKKIHGFQFMENLERCMITPSSVMMQKDMFYEAGKFNESLPACEDYDLWLRITSRYPVGLIDELLVTRFGGGSDQLSTTVMGLDRFRIRSIMDCIKNCALSPEQCLAAKRVLVRKAGIVANGYKKRGNYTEHLHYTNIAEMYV